MTQKMNIYFSTHLPPPQGVILPDLPLLNLPPIRNAHGRWVSPKLSSKFVWPRPGQVCSPKRLRPPGPSGKDSTAPPLPSESIHHTEALPWLPPLSVAVDEGRKSV